MPSSAVERLLVYVSASAVGRLHGMQRLDRERHANLAREVAAMPSTTCVRAECPCGPVEPPQHPGQSAHNQHQARRAQGLGLINRRPGCPSRAARGPAVGGRKEAAAAVGVMSAACRYHATFSSSPNLIAPGRMLRMPRRA